MTDMLVKLYELAPLAPIIAAQAEKGIMVRRGLAPEKHFVLAWVKKHFNDSWVSETDVAFSRTPVSCFIATKDGKPIGFGCYDTTRLGFFGPTGVSEVARGQGTGTALLLACLHDMWAKGYGYAIIGYAGPVEYYKRTCGAIPIENSIPGVYTGMLQTSE